MDNSLIYRQAAIDVIDAAFPVDPMKSEYAQGIACGAALAKTYVEQLPSAQPQKVCVAEIKVEIDEIKDYIDKAINAERWIPCDERLPEDDTLMLVNYIDERPDAMDIWIGWHEMENVWYIDGEEHSREHGNEVIAWMPMPKPYAERREE